MHVVLVYIKLRSVVYIQCLYSHIYRGGSGFRIPDWHSSQKFWLPWAQRLARGGGKGSTEWKECYCHPAYREWQKPLLPATTFCWCGHSSCHLPNTQPDTRPSGGLAQEGDSCHLFVLYTVRCFSAYCCSKKTLQGC